ncbi:hypothetical protein HDU98_005358, partial [Podochytrium sp. JEL0797]
MPHNEILDRRANIDNSDLDLHSIIQSSLQPTTGPKPRRSLNDLINPLQLADPWQEFKLFVVQTKILESGVGVVIGRAFQDCIKSFVNDLLLILKQGRTKKKYKTIEEAAFDGAITVNYGRFSHNVVNFLVVGLSVYYVLKGLKAFFKRNLTHLKKCAFCISEIPA